MSEPNFVTSSQDFHIKFIKNVIELKNLAKPDIQNRIISKREISRIKRKTGAPL